MKYIFLILICALFLISCSTPDSRKQIASELGEVIYQQKTEANNIPDIFLVVREKQLKIVLVTSFSEISKVDNISEYEIQKIKSSK